MTSSESGKPFGSCATTAARYWFITPSRHARSQSTGIGPVDAFTRVVLTPAAATAATSARRPRAERMNASCECGGILFDRVVENVEVGARSAGGNAVGQEDV